MVSVRSLEVSDVYSENLRTLTTIDMVLDARPGFQISFIGWFLCLPLKLEPVLSQKQVNSVLLSCAPSRVLGGVCV